MKRAGAGLVIFVAVMGMAATALAQEKVIKLKDGSLIKGVVVAKSGDIYKIKSPAFGFLSLRQADIASIEDPAREKPAPAAPPAAAVEAASVAAPVVQSATIPGVSTALSESGTWKGYQEKIMSNPESMSAIQALTQDQDIMDIINDPQLRAAILSGNIDYLKNNEKFLKFASNPKVQQITEAALGPGQGAQHAGQDKNQSGN